MFLELNALLVTVTSCRFKRKKKRKEEEEQERGASKLWADKFWLTSFRSSGSNGYLRNVSRASQQAQAQSSRKGKVKAPDQEAQDLQQVRRPPSSSSASLTPPHADHATPPPPLPILPTQEKRTTRAPRC